MLWTAAEMHATQCRCCRPYLQDSLFHAEYEVAVPSSTKAASMKFRHEGQVLRQAAQPGPGEYDSAGAANRARPSAAAFTFGESREHMPLGSSRCARQMHDCYVHPTAAACSHLRLLLCPMHAEFVHRVAGKAAAQPSVAVLVAPRLTSSGSCCLAPPGSGCSSAHSCEQAGLMLGYRRYFMAGFFVSSL